MLLLGRQPDVGFISSNREWKYEEKFNINSFTELLWKTPFIFSTNFHSTSAVFDWINGFIISVKCGDVYFMYFIKQKGKVTFNTTVLSWIYLMENIFLLISTNLKSVVAKNNDWYGCSTSMLLGEDLLVQDTYFM